MKAKVLKEWCEENISPLAWKRITLKVMDTLYDKGFTMNDIENPGSGLKLDDDLFKKIQKVVQEMYEIELMADFQEA